MACRNEFIDLFTTLDLDEVAEDYKKKNKSLLKIGTKVVTRHGEAKVTGIELCQNGEKYGIDMDKVFSTLMKTRARYVLFETSNPRHAHEWTVFRDRAGGNS